MTSNLPTWQTILKNSITNPEALFEQLNLPRGYLPIAQKVIKQFGLRVTQRYIDKIEPGNLDDPLLKQILPLEAELETAPHYSVDPLLEETQSVKQPGLLHKYQNRVLITFTGACAIHCRYCFRRHFDYQSHTPARSAFMGYIDYLNTHPEIEEVILSGGDPLTVPDDRLNFFLDLLETKTQIQTLRIHSRLPIVLPERMTDSLLNLLTNRTFQTVLVLHTNHPNEIDADIKTMLKQCYEKKITLLNQSVLLAGVNDCPRILKQLHQSLFECHVLPYYLHLQDKVLGTHHFEVSDTRAKEIYQTLQGISAGYLVPRLVREIPNTPSKILVHHTTVLHTH